MSRRPLFTQGGGRTPVKLPESRIEAAHAAKPGLKSDLANGQRAGVEKPFGSLNPQRLGDLSRRSPEMFPEEARKMARSNAQPLGQVFHAAVIECTLLEQAERPLDRRPSALPGWTEGRRFRSAAQAGTVPGRLGGCRACIETDVLRQRLLHAANRTAVDASGSNGDEEQAVERRVPPQSRFVAGFEIEHA